MVAGQVRAFRSGAASFFGVAGVGAQDKEISESQEPIYDRTQERLGRADIAIIRIKAPTTPRLTALFQ